MNITLRLKGADAIEGPTRTKKKKRNEWLRTKYRSSNSPPELNLATLSSTPVTKI